MASVSSTSSAAEVFAALNAAARSGTGTTTSASEETQNRFLTLLVTQLKNQDPLNPLDNAAVTSQLAQLNTVSGIEKLNTTLAALLGSFEETQAMQGTGMIGKNVLVPGSRLVLSNGQALGGVRLDSAADSVTVTVFDATGTRVQRQKLGAHEAGNFRFVWDGKTDAGGSAAAGKYRFTVDAERGGDKVGAAALQLGTVSALVRDQSGFQLELSELGRVDFSQVQQLL